MMDVNIVIPVRTTGVFAEQTCIIGLIDGLLQSLALADEFTAHINVTSMRAHCETCQQTPFEKFMWLVTHNITVFTCAGLRLISIHHKVMRASVIFFWHERPFQTRRKTGAAPTPQTGCFDFFNHPITAFSK